MSRNAAFVNRLEYYMDDLVDCFEDFVKKSLFVISVALGTIILMIMYVLKMLAERNNVPNTEPSVRCRNINCGVIPNAFRQCNNNPDVTKNNTAVECDDECIANDKDHKKTETVLSNYVLNEDNTASFSAQVATRPSFDEKVLREIGLSSCPNPCNASDKTVPCNDAETRNNTQTQQIHSCTSKEYLPEPRPSSKYIATRTSCCSLCCMDDDRR